MSLERQHDGREMYDFCALALSASQTRGRTLDCDELFSKRSESHSLELTRFTHDASHTPSTHRFTSSSQLSAYFEDDKSNMSEQRGSLDI